VPNNDSPQAAMLNGGKMLRILNIAVLALMLIAATGEAKENCNPEVFQAEVDKLVASDTTNSTEPGGVVFVGSSSIRMWDLKKSFPDQQYLNRGFGGSQICQSTHFFDELIAKHKPRIVVFYAGDNDIAGGKSPGQVQSDFLDFAELFLSKLPEAKLVYISIKPSIARWKLADKMREANKLIAADCEKNDNFTFVDVWPAMLKDGEPRKDIFLGDGLHMNDTGYAEWVKLVAPLLD
jgi:lysophospholipase L1-like esterase